MRRAGGVRWEPERQIGSHLVPVPTPASTLLDASGFFQVGDDALDRSLRDLDKGVDVVDPRLWLPGETQVNVCVAGEKVHPPFSGSLR